MNERDQEIVQMCQSGVTMQVVGDKFGITRERVRQIAKKCGIVGVDMAQKRRQEREQAKINAFLSDTGAVIDLYWTKIEAELGEKLEIRFLTTRLPAVFTRSGVRISIHGEASAFKPNEGYDHEYHHGSANTKMHHVFLVKGRPVLLVSKNVATSEARNVSAYIPARMSPGDTHYSNHFKMVML